MSEQATKKLFIKTYGCQMNVYDSERMMDLLAPFGYQMSDKAEGSDMVILNTCHIREKASEKVFSALGQLRKLQAKKHAAGSKMILAVAGCVAQAEGKEILRRAPYVDMVFGPQTYHQLPEMLTKLLEKKEDRKAILNIEFPTESKFDHLPKETLNKKISTFVSIQEGCDKFCTYCVVPYTRGAEVSRPADAIIEECSRLVAQGTKDIMLLGQNVNAYHGLDGDGNKVTLGGLIRRIADIEGLLRIQYTTSHPRDVDQELLEAHRDVKKLAAFLHLPVQSGSDKVLDIMNRKHTAEHYRSIIKKLREYRPDIAFSSDFIVGHPGESDQDFSETIKLINDVSFAQAFSFKYSPRPGTPAATFDFQVEESIKSKRLAMLQQLLKAQQSAYNESFIGSEVEVLFEKYNEDTGMLVGKTAQMQWVHASGNPRLIGKLLHVKIEAAATHQMRGTIVTSAQN